MCIVLPFNYQATHFPQEIALRYEMSPTTRTAVVKLEWITVDGRTIPLSRFGEPPPFEAELLFYGELYGVAGTDSRRQLIPCSSDFIASALVLYLTWAAAMLGGRGLCERGETIEPTATVSDEAPAPGPSPAFEPQTSESVELSDLELETDEDKWGLAQQLPHSVSYDTVKRVLAAPSELPPGAGSAVSTATRRAGPLAGK